MSDSNKQNTIQDDNFFALLRFCVVCEEVINKAVLAYILNIINNTDLFTVRIDKLLPFLYQNCVRYDLFPQIDISSQEVLKNSTTQAIVTELVRQAQLREVIDAFQTAGISLILLKGIAFAGELYTQD
jgi:hypothetical protein